MCDDNAGENEDRRGWVGKQRNCYEFRPGHKQYLEGMVTEPRGYVEVDIGVMNGVNAPEWADGVKCEVRNITDEVKYQNAGEKTKGPRNGGRDLDSPPALLNRERESNARQGKNNK